MKRFVAAILVPALAPIAHAASPPAGGQYTAYARVIDVQPRYDAQQISTPVEHCRWEHAPAVTRRYLNNGQPQYVRKRIKRCHTRLQTEHRQVITGYSVQLNYNGVVFERDVLERPLDRVPITIEVSP